MEEDGIDSMPWLVKGADVNVIELAWAWMKRRLAKAKFDTFEDFRQKIRAEWDAIPQEFIKHWINGLPARVLELSESKGEVIPWHK